MTGIVLLTMARSRSSMTAEIYRRHGVFFGNTRSMDDPGWHYNENLALKRLIRRARPKLYPDLIMEGRDPRPKVTDFPEWWAETLTSEGYEGGPWGVKTDAFCHALFDGIPHVKIGIWRNPADIVKSCLRVLSHRFDDENDWRKIIAAHHDLLTNLRIPIVNTDEVVSGDHSSLERAFAACGLTYDRQIAESVIRT